MRRPYGATFPAKGCFIFFPPPLYFTSLQSHAARTGSSKHYHDNLNLFAQNVHVYPCECLRKLAVSN